MRTQLKSHLGQRKKFTARVERFGAKSAFRGPDVPTILLVEIRAVDGDGKVLADHLWFTKGKSWSCCQLGQWVEFEARVSAYQKGYKGRRDDVWDAPVSNDYRLERPTRIRVLDSAPSAHQP